MPVNGFTVGRDVTVTLAGPGGTGIVIPANSVTHFTKRPIKKEDWSHPLNLPPIPLILHDGWRGTVEVDRQDSTLDSFQAALEANYWAGLNNLSGTILESITETTGKNSQFRYDDVLYWVSEPGDGTPDRKLSQRIEWACGTRKQVS